MSLSALPTALAVPPVNLLVACFAGVLTIRRYPKAGMAVLLLGLCGLLLLATPAVGDRLLTALEQDLPLVPPAGSPPQAIVILSAEIVRSADAANPEPGPLTLQRERVGAALARRTGLPLLVTGGVAGSSQDTTLAAVMARSLADDFGTPVRWTEQEATDTWENASFSAAMLKAQNIRSIYLVTHAWHMRRALIAFAHTGITVTAAPVQMDRSPGVSLSDFIPRTSTWLASYYALHEWIGCFDYLWFH